jgi:chemotaxis protein methyltransferase CheR
MVLHELIPNIQAWDIQIVATDICDSALQQAKRGLYSAFEVERGLPPARLSRYLTRQGAGYRVNDSLRSMVSFNRQNLLEPFAQPGPFDVIFCRNVVIYFDAPTRKNIFQRLKSSLSTDGYLFVGSAESLADLGPAFRPHHHCRAVFYRPNLALTP